MFCIPFSEYQFHDWVVACVFQICLSNIVYDGGSDSAKSRFSHYKVDAHEVIAPILGTVEFHKEAMTKYIQTEVAILSPANYFGLNAFDPET